MGDSDCTTNRLTRLAAAVATAGLVAITGCSFDEDGISSRDGSTSTPDAATANVDAGATSPDARGSADARPSADAIPCVGDTLLTLPYSNVDACDIPAPTGPLNLMGDEIWFLDTDDGAVYRQSDNATRTVASALVSQTSPGPMVRVVTVTDLFIGNPPGDGITALGVSGDHPLIIVVTGNATINGYLYAGGAKQDSGPGGNSPACGAGVGTAGGIIAGAGGGGGGGGYGGTGGNGATSSGDDIGPDFPVAGGPANGNLTITPLRGGCAGGPGGNLGGPGGGGGGAVQLIVEGELRIQGFISVRGGGGAPPQPSDNQPSEAAGGGGGSGGALLLQANTLTIAGGAILVAHGGGGGEGTRSGGTDFGGETGQDGHNFDEAPAEGGGDNSSSAGGDGGNGGVGGQAAEAGEIGSSGDGLDGGGGGGGGAVGRIRFSSLNPSISGSALISPSAQ